VKAFVPYGICIQLAWFHRAPLPRRTRAQCMADKTTSARAFAFEVDRLMAQTASGDRVVIDCEKREQEAWRPRA
jgi:hypothetical protein